MSDDPFGDALRSIADDDRTGFLFRAKVAAALARDRQAPDGEPDESDERAELASKGGLREDASDAE